MELLLELCLQGLKTFPVRLLRGLQFGDTCVLLCDSASGVLVASLPLFMLCFIRAAALSFAFEKLGELFGFESVAFKQGVAVFQEALCI